MSQAHLHHQAPPHHRQVTRRPIPVLTLAPKECSPSNTYLFLRWKCTFDRMRMNGFLGEDSKNEKSNDYSFEAPLEDQIDTLKTSDYFQMARINFLFMNI